MKRASLTDRLRYAFDNTMSRGPVALIAWLALISMTVIVVVAFLVWSLGIAAQPSLVDQMWEYLMHALGDFDPRSETPWSFRLATLIVTITGIFVMSTLIGVLTTGIEEKLTDLRKGRSRVIESGHTIILGWSKQVFYIISELVIANENQRKSCIAILSGEDKVEMEDAIRDQVGSTGRTRIVCRRGSPMDMSDLEIVSPHTAKSIIILSPEDDDPDASVIKTLLAIVNNPNRRSEPYHIVTELHNPRNVDVARLVGRDEVELVFTSELTARITAQTCRQSGLSVVYTELMNFAGDEIYFQDEPALVGKTFGESLLAYEDSAVIGLLPKGDGPRLNPPMDTRIQAGDQIIAISEDDDTVVLSGKTDLGIAPTAIRATEPVEASPERVLILGWNWRGPIIVGELDNYVAPGSAITIVAEGVDEAEVMACCPGFENQTVGFQQGDITDRRVLNRLPFETIDHVILLAYSDTLDSEKADARTLITLLHLRDIDERLGHRFSIVSEMLDIHNQELAQVTRADDFVVSDKLISLVLSQISEHKALSPVFADLFDPEGSEIYLKPATDYVKPGQPVNFYTVVEAARQQGAVALGYRVQAQANDVKGYGVVVNPAKSAPVVFAEGDRIIVLAQD